MIDGPLGVVTSAITASEMKWFLTISGIVTLGLALLAGFLEHSGTLHRIFGVCCLIDYGKS